MSGFAFPCANCGCQPGCLIVRDRFTRDASTDLGSLWAEIAGDASVGPDVFSDGSKLLMPSTGIVECTQAAPAPAGTNGHGCRWTVMWGNLVSISRFLRVHVDAINSNNSHYMEVKVDTSVPKFMVEVFKLEAGTPTSIAGPTDCLDVNEGNLNSDQFLCLSIDGTTINAVVNTVLVSASTTPHGGTKVRVESVNTSNMALDDFELFRIRDPDCPHCTGDEPVGEECEICENADEDRPNEVLPELLVTLAGLADKFIDTLQWSLDGQNLESGSNGADDETWDYAAFNDSFVIPFLHCESATGGSDGIACSPNIGSSPPASTTIGHDGAVLYGTGGGYYGIVEGLIWREGERPYAYQCFGTAKPGSADPFDTLLPVTQDLRLKINVWLAKKISGGFKIYASIVFYFDTHYCQNNNDDPWGTSWGVVNSGFNLEHYRAVFEGDWDGDCLALEEVAMALVEECPNTVSFFASRIPDTTSLTLTVGPAP